MEKIENRTVVIGITGLIASGKSTVAKKLRNKGFAVIDTDKLAKDIIQENTVLQKKITDLLGEEAFVDGIYQTNYVSHLIFSNTLLRQSLNTIVHPYVIQAIINQLNTKYKELSIVFIESALLYESHLNNLCHGIIEVRAPLIMRMRRLMERDHIDFVTALKKIKSQKRINMKTNKLVLLNGGGRTLSELCDWAILYSEEIYKAENC